jgi:alpha-L-fucosidase
MFVHWGIYAPAARHEWVMNREEMTVEEYSRYFRHFEPDLYDAGEWARAAREAGMKYVVLTAKHHDGFCLWDSALTDYKAPNTPAGRDLLREYVDAMRGEGLRVGFYYSLLDWHHPDFTVDGVHPQRNAPNVEELNAGRDMARYREYLQGQVRELLTSYGQIDYLFFDFSYADPNPHSFWGGKGRKEWDSEALLAIVRELQPSIVINDRLEIPGDLVTPEQYQPAGPMLVDGKPVTWEACQTLNGSWGYDRDNTNFKPVDLLIRMLVDGVSKGGNLLLNVGPTGRGNLDPRAKDSLAGMGKWMRLHSRSIYGAGPSDLVPPPDARYTRRGDRLYVHLFAWPFEFVHLPGLGGKVEYAQLLNDGSEVMLKESDPEQEATTIVPGGQPAGTLTIKLPVQRPDVAVPVLELFLKDQA